MKLKSLLFFQYFHSVGSFAVCAHVDGNKSHPLETLNIFKRECVESDVDPKKHQETTHQR